MNLDLPPLDAGNSLPSSSQQAFTPIVNSHDRDPEFLPSSDAVDLTEIHAAARLRRSNPRKGFAKITDTQIEIRNRDLLAQSATYLTRMREAAAIRLAHRLPAQSRRNAEYWILKIGLFGAGLPLPCAIRSDLAGPFSGEQLFESITGSKLEDGLFQAGKRRMEAQQQDQDGSDEAGRRVRSREELQPSSMSLADMMNLDDYEDLPRMDDGFDPNDMERLRAGDSIGEAHDLEDISSAMPWNISASLRSRRASSVIQGSAVRGSRIRVSASPVVGIPAPLEELPTRKPLNSLEPFADEHLDKHAQNFLDHVRDAVRAKYFPATSIEELEDDMLLGNRIAFGEVFDASRMSKRVASQAFLHALTLGTKNVLNAIQEEAYGEIFISLL
jgi:meiotic recombination protein REC8, fungi type